MKRYVVIRPFALLTILTIFVLSCSQIPEDYKPPQYRKIAVFAIYPKIEEIDLGSSPSEAIGGIATGILSAIVGDYPEWEATSQLSLVSVRCGYDVYLVGPDDYFENRKSKVEVQHQKRFDEGLPGDYKSYVKKMKSLIGKNMQPIAYLCGYVESSDDDNIWIEMRRWEDDNLLFKMNYNYFMKHYSEFFCGADME